MRRREVTALLSQCNGPSLRYTYAPDHFARVLLRHARLRHPSWSDLRASSFGRLLDRPFLKPHLARLKRDAALNAALSERPADGDLRYRLTFGRWGYSEPTNWPCGDQTSRPGENVVLQLNFTRSHNRAYQQLLQPKEPLFNSIGHPVHPELLTLSWARIDLEESFGEATIEEIQSDWLRDAAAAARHAREKQSLPGYLHDLIDAEPWALVSYFESVLALHARFWAEATLTAAIEWLVERRGIRRIFYNSWETGLALKNLDPAWGPPRSLYTDLPRLFCFRATRQIPKALARCKVAEVQRRIHSRGRSVAERLHENGQWRTVSSRSEPRWFLLEL